MVLIFSLNDAYKMRVYSGWQCVCKPISCHRGEKLCKWLWGGAWNYNRKCRPRTTTWREMGRSILFVMWSTFVLVLQFGHNKTRKAFNDFTRIMSQAGREEPRRTERKAGKHVPRFRPQSMSLSLSLPAIWATAARWASGGCVGWIINELCRSAKSWYSLGQWPGTISLIWFGKTPRGRTRLKEITSQSINRK